MGKMKISKLDHRTLRKRNLLIWRVCSTVPGRYHTLLLMHAVHSSVADPYSQSPEPDTGFSTNPKPDRDPAITINADTCGTDPDPQH
jgi:hypothetical protein